jgi:hypothetical protein
MRDVLGWTWDSKKGWFYADLTPQNVEAVIKAWTRHRCLYINLSAGVREYRAQQRDQAVPVAHTRGKSKLFKS